MLSKIFRIISNVILALVLVVGILVALSFSNNPSGIKLFTVMSGSMEPVLHTGSVIFIKSVAEYQINDIITRATDDPKVTITHRVIAKSEIDGQKSYQTQGDANDASDEGYFPQSSVLGKEFLTIPYLGYLINFAKTTQGLILIIVIPAVIIVYDELNKIKKEIGKIIKKRKKKKNESEVDVIENIEIEHAQSQEGEEKEVRRRIV